MRVASFAEEVVITQSSERLEGFCLDEWVVIMRHASMILQR